MQNIVCTEILLYYIGKNYDGSANNDEDYCHFAVNYSLLVQFAGVCACVCARFHLSHTHSLSLHIIYLFPDNTNNLMPLHDYFNANALILK